MDNLIKQIAVHTTANINHMWVDSDLKLPLKNHRDFNKMVSYCFYHETVVQLCQLWCFSHSFSDLTRWDHNNIVQKGADEIQVKYNFMNFPSKLLIFRWENISSNWISSQQPDEAYNTKKWEKKTGRTPENIAPVRDSVRRLRPPCSYVPLEQQWPHGAYFMNCFRTV